MSSDTDGKEGLTNKLTDFDSPSSGILGSIQTPADFGADLRRYLAWGHVVSQCGCPFLDRFPGIASSFYQASAQPRCPCRDN